VDNHRHMKATRTLKFFGAAQRFFGFTYFFYFGA
jgi:hypothetical protein